MSEGLVVSHLDAWYGALRALEGISLSLRRGEVVALIGANGAGKSSLMRAIAGVMPVPGQDIRLDGTVIAGLAPDHIAHLGIAMVPEGRRLFADLTVSENLLMGQETGRVGAWSLERVMTVFPALKERRSHKPGQLSGGQQQMVAIGRALMANPSVVMLDEVSLGLAPRIIEELYRAMPEILGQDLGALIVEQDIGRALAVSHRFICLREGAIVLEGPSAGADRHTIANAYFGAQE